MKGQKLAEAFIFWVLSAALLSPDFSVAQPKITSVEPLSKDATQYETFELKLAITAEHANPFDSSDIQITGQFQDAEDNLYVAGGFVYREYERKLNQDNFEELTPVGEPEWRIRFTPPEPGEYSYIITVATAAGRTFSRQRRFACKPSDEDGFVRTICGRYFQYDSGRPFFCIGQNLAWSRGGGGTHDYDRWLEKLAESGANFVRIWLWRNPTFDLELMPRVDLQAGLVRHGGVGRYDLGNAWRLDYVLRRCESLGIKVMLCFFDFHPLTEDFRWFGALYHPWENCVYNTINGGPLADPADFFSDEETIAAARQLVRYVVNRYSSNTAILCWELFNEVDLAPGYRTRLDEIQTWHVKMAELIDSLDPCKRPVTTSCADGYNRSRLWADDAIRIVQSHSYDEKDMGGAVPVLVRSFDSLAKPHLTGEISHDVNLVEGEEQEDPTGQHLHNAIWASMASGSAGGPLTWWWDTYIDPLGLYSIYTVPSQFAETIDWCAQELKPAAVQIQSAAADIKENVKVSAYVHGTAHKENLGPGPTFEVEYAFDGTFSLHVDRVAGGAALRVYLDSRLVLQEELPASKARGSWKQITWHQDYQYWEAVYDRDFAITVPKGKHIISIRNDGVDWMIISSIKLLNYAERGVFMHIETDPEWGEAVFDQYKIKPTGRLIGYPSISLRALALSGTTTTIAWVQNQRNTWHNRRGNAPPPRPTRGLLVFPGLGPGTYAVQRWNTYTGEIEEEFAVDVPAESSLRLVTPFISADTAYRIERKVGPPLPPEPVPDE